MVYNYYYIQLYINEYKSTLHFLVTCIHDMYCQRQKLLGITQRLQELIVAISLIQCLTLYCIIDFK